MERVFSYFAKNLSQSSLNYEAIQTKIADEDINKKLAESQSSLNYEAIQTDEFANGRELLMTEVSILSELRGYSGSPLVTYTIS